MILAFFTLLRVDSCIYQLINSLMKLASLIKKSFATSGHLLTWGETTYGWGRPATNQYWTPGYVQNFGDVISVSTGKYHLGFLTKDNSVYTVGLEQDGRLGHVINADTELPRRLSFDRPDIQIAKISCGTRHSLALTSEGAVYSWGYAQALGVLSASETGVPVRIPQQHFQNDKVIAIAAADDFSAALCDKGHFYTWGSGLYSLPKWSQVSQVPEESQEVAQLVGKRHAKIKKFAAIDRFILLLLDNGRIYCRGINNGGVFGARTNPLVMSDNSLPSFSRTHDQLYKDEKIVDFEASSNSLIFKTETGKLFYNGFFDKWQPTPFPLQVKAKKIFASESSVGVITNENKLYFLNEKLIDDSDYVCKRNKVYLCEDPNFQSQILDIGGTYHLRYALVK